MLAFFEKTWVLWWMLAVVVILRRSMYSLQLLHGILPNRLSMTATNTPFAVSWLPEPEMP
jgi:hypothetical protein